MLSKEIIAVYSKDHTKHASQADAFSKVQILELEKNFPTFRRTTEDKKYTPAVPPPPPRF